MTPLQSNTILPKGSIGETPPGATTKTYWDVYQHAFFDKEAAYGMLGDVIGQGRRNMFLANMLIAYSTPDMVPVHPEYSQIIGRIGKMVKQIRAITKGDAHFRTLDALWMCFTMPDFEKAYDRKTDILLPTRILDYLTKVVDGKKSSDAEHKSARNSNESARAEAMFS